MKLCRLELGCFGCEVIFKLDKKQFVSIEDSEIRAGVKIYKVKFKCPNCGRNNVYCVSECLMKEFGIFDWKSVEGE